MKKVILLIFFTTLLSCSSDDNNSKDSKNSFNPPAWIQGRWINNEIIPLGFKFSKNDVCNIQYTTDLCIKAALDIYNGTQAQISIDEEIKSDTEYKFSYTVQGTTINYHFIKVAPTKIQEVLADPNGDLLYTKK